MLEKKVFAGMNKDGSPKDLRPEEIRHAKNLVAVRDGVGLSARLENMFGMERTGITTFIDNKNIGAWNYKAESKIYLFYSAVIDHIIEYNGVDNTAVVLVINNLLGFDPTKPVYDVFRIENLLYFNDGVSGMKKINIDYAKTQALDDVIDARAFLVIKAPPLREIPVNRITDIAVVTTRPRIRETPLQFSQRYVYKDDETSVISIISKIAPVVDWDFDDNKYNAVELYVSIDQTLRDLIDRVELLVREGNNQPWYIYDDFDASVITNFLIDNGDGTKSMQYILYLDKSGGTLSKQEVGTTSESVPRVSKAIGLMENRLFATSSVEEYDVHLDDWDGTINLVEQSGSSAITRDRLNAGVYNPLFYKENSYYTWGVVFFDENGRKTAPVVRKNMRKQIGDNMSAYTVNKSIPHPGAQNGWLLYNHPTTYEALPAMSGKPPPTAVKYQFARSANQSYTSWFKAKFLVMPLATPERKDSEPDATFTDLYLDNGYWYISVHKILRDYQDYSRAIGLPHFVDLVIPDGFPIPIDENSIVRLAFDYPVRSEYAGNPVADRKNYSIAQIENGRIRVKGLQWIDIIQTWITDADAICGLGFNETTPKQVCFNEEAFLHFEILNPVKRTSNPLMYEIGEIYDVVNPGLDGRAFQPTHFNIQGDSYYAAYQDLGSFFVDNADESIHVRPKGGTTRDERWQATVAFASLSPIADRERAGVFVEPKTGDTGLGGLLGAGAQASEGGLYDKSKDDSKGRATVEVPNQKELHRGGQVRWSRTFIQDSLVNGLSNFPEENKHALASDRGDITKLIPSNEKVLVAVHPRGITSLYINRQFINTGEGAPFLAQTDRVIGDDPSLVLDYGSTHPESIVLHDSRVYGFDSIMSEPWRRSQDGITPLALTYGMKTYFEGKGSQIRFIQLTDPSAEIRVLGGFDPWLDMYVITFSEISYLIGGDTIVVPAETIGFSEKVKRWVSFYDFFPEYYSTIQNNLVSLKDGSLWRHMETADRNLFYGQYFPSSITIQANESNDVSKLYQNIGISSTKKWTLSCITPDNKESILSLSNFTLRDNIFYADFLRDKNSSAEGLAAGQTPLLHGEKLIGETMEITLTNEDTDRVVLDAVYIGYSPVAGHLLSAT